MLQICSNQILQIPSSLILFVDRQFLNEFLKMDPPYRDTANVCIVQKCFLIYVQLPVRLYSLSFMTRGIF